MNFAVVLLTLGAITPETVVARITIYASWQGGIPVQRRLKIPITDAAVGLPGLHSVIKADVIAWAASVAGGSVTLTRNQVLIDMGAPQITGARLNADFTVNTNPAFADVTGLSVDLAPNSHYRFTFEGAYSSAAAATAIHLAVNGPASPTFLRGIGTIYTAAGTPFSAAFGAYDTPIAPGTSGGATFLPFRLTGTISTNAAGGAFTLRARSETNGTTVTVGRGSFCEMIAVI